MQRARLDNLEGNLRFLLNDRVSRGRKRLRRAIKDFLYLDMKAAAVAAAADLSRTYLGKRVKVRAVVANLLDLELPGP